MSSVGPVTGTWEGVELETALWCPACLLPSGFRYSFAITWDDGSVQLFTLCKCADCERAL